MEKDSGFWFHHQHLHPLTPNQNLLGRQPFDIDRLGNQSVHRNPYLIGDSALATVPFHAVSHLNPWKANEPKVSSNWIYDMPPSHAACTPVLNAVTEEYSIGPTSGIVPAQKRFLVFDQSGDKTTLIYSSGVEDTAGFGAHVIPTPPTTYDLNNEGPPVTVSLRHGKPIKDDHGDDKWTDDTKDEMREDTEELNALLYSDNYFSEDDEETSTGHSPSTMTDNGTRDSDEEAGEEVDSSFGSIKKRKLLNGSLNVPSNILATSFINTTSPSSAVEDDAVSSSGTCNMQNQENNGSSCLGKRPRKDKIRETVSILQSIIPGVNGKDAVVVIDEAILYLKSLKAQAMALGLDTLNFSASMNKLGHK